MQRALAPLRRVELQEGAVRREGVQERQQRRDGVFFPTFKGVWSTVANFAPLPLPDTRHGQYP